MSQSVKQSKKGQVLEYSQEAQGISFIRHRPPLQDVSKDKEQEKAQDTSLQTN